jgi:hypothetical protein
MSPDECAEWMTGEFEDDEPPADWKQRMEDAEERIMLLEENVAAMQEELIILDARITALEAAAPEPDPLPDDGTIVALVCEDAPAFSYKAKNAKGKPIMAINVYQESGDITLKWGAGDRLWVKTEATVADGGSKWHEITAIVTPDGAEPVFTYGYPALYIRADKILL